MFPELGAFFVEHLWGKSMPLLHWKGCKHVEKVFTGKDLSGHLCLYLQLCLSVKYRP